MNPCADFNGMNEIAGRKAFRSILQGRRRPLRLKDSRTFPSGIVFFRHLIASAPQLSMQRKKAEADSLRLWFRFEGRIRSDKRARYRRAHSNVCAANSPAGRASR